MSSSRPLTSQAVLVVADEDWPHDGLVQELQALGCTVVTARSAAEAHAVAAATRPALVVIGDDVRGSDALHERLRSDWRCGRPAIVVGDRTDLDSSALVGRIGETLQRVRELRAASPLTGLPGNDAIREEIDRRLCEGQRIALLYADLDAFKPYNDTYGFLRGDAVLRALGDVLSAEADRHRDTFVGHVGGDDFVVLARPEDAEAIAQAITDSFDAAAPTFYEPEDAARGWVMGSDRRGGHQRWPLLSLSVGIATNERRRVDDALELVDIATEMKRLAKNRAGSAFAVDRRSDVVPIRPLRRSRVDASRLRGHLARLAAAVAAVMLVLTPGGVALAATAAPGDALWPARRWVEDARVALADDPLTRAELHLRFADQRLADLAAALVVGAEPRVVDSTLAELVRHSSAATGGIATGGEGDDEGLRNKAGAVLDRHVEILGGLVAARCAPSGVVASSPSVHSCTGLEHALGIAAAGARLLDNDQGRHEEQSPLPHAETESADAVPADAEPSAPRNDAEPPGQKPAGTDAAPPGQQRARPEDPGPAEQPGPPARPEQQPGQPADPGAPEQRRGRPDDAKATGRPNEPKRAEGADRSDKPDPPADPGPGEGRGRDR